MKLSIIIPAHNEQDRLPPVLRAYAELFAARLGEAVEIIVVVNGSLDETALVASGLAIEFPFIRVIEEAGRIGKGGAVIRGLNAAKGDCIGFVDADGATSPEEFYSLYTRMSGCDVGIASRYLKESMVEPRQPVRRIIASRCFNLMVRVLFGLRLADTQCGAKIFRAEVLQTILPRLGVTNWAFDVDMLVQSHWAGFSVKEFSTVWRDQSGSQLRVMRAGSEMFVALVRLRLVYSPFRWVVRMYDRVMLAFKT